MRSEVAAGTNRASSKWLSTGLGLHNGSEMATARPAKRAANSPSTFRVFAIEKDRGWLGATMACGGAAEAVGWDENPPANKTGTDGVSAGVYRAMERW